MGAWDLVIEGVELSVCAIECLVERLDELIVIECLTK